MSNRKPYVREVKRTWWKDHPFYRFYKEKEENAKEDNRKGR